VNTEASAWISADRIAAELNLADMVEPVADALRAYSRGAATSTALGLLRLAGNGEAHVKTGQPRARAPRR